MLAGLACLRLRKTLLGHDQYECAGTVKTGLLDVYDRCGLVRVFEWSGMSWNQLGEYDWVLASRARVAAISADGKVIAMGGTCKYYWDNSRCTEYPKGYVDVRHWDGFSWQRKIPIIDPRAYGHGVQRFGEDIDLSADGQILAVAAKGRDSGIFVYDLTKHLPSRVIPKAAVPGSKYSFIPIAQDTDGDSFTFSIQNNTFS